MRSEGVIWYKLSDKVGLYIQCLFNNSLEMSLSIMLEFNVEKIVLLWIFISLSWKLYEMSLLEEKVYFVRSLTWESRLATVCDLNNKSPLMTLLSSHWPTLSSPPLLLVSLPQGILSLKSKVFVTTWQFIPLQSDLWSRINQISRRLQASGPQSLMWIIK